MAPAIPVTEKNQYPWWEAAITLGAYILMIVGNAVGNAVGDNNIGDVSEAYPQIAVPKGVAFSWWGVIFALEGGYAICGFIFPGDNQLASPPNDLGSFNRSIRWVLRVAFIFQGVWPLLFTQTDLMKNTLGVIGDEPLVTYMVRGEGGDAWIWISHIVLLSLFGMMCWVTLKYYQVFSNPQANEFNKDLKIVFWAGLGLPVNAGWLLAASGFTFNMMAVSLTNPTDTGKAWMCVVAAFVVALQIGLLVFVLWRARDQRWVFIGPFITLAWAFFWVFMHILPETPPSEHRALMIATYGNGFVDVFFGISIFVFAFCVACSIWLAFKIGDMGHGEVDDAGVDIEIEEGVDAKATKLGNSVEAH